MMITSYHISEMKAMNNLKEFYFLSSNEKNNIRTRLYTPESGNIRATVQIAHGIAEHCERYDEFCRFLCDNGFAVYINDHLGHGKSVQGDAIKGYFAPKDGWMKVVSDMHTIYTISAEEYPEVPHFLFGHSMGSFLARTYLFTYPQDFKGAVICGTSHMARAVIAAGKAMASVSAAISPTKFDKALEGVAFGSYNNSFKPIRTNYDWLTRVPETVDAYIADPMCGFTCTSRLYADMMQGLMMITDKKNIDKMNKETPVLFISGSMDPVGENGEGVKRAYAYFLASGMKDVTLKLYDGARHELLNETNKAEVMNDVLNWINEKI